MALRIPKAPQDPSTIMILAVSKRGDILKMPLSKDGLKPPSPAGGSIGVKDLLLSINTVSQGLQGGLCLLDTCC